MWIFANVGTCVVSSFALTRVGVVVVEKKHDHRDHGWMQVII